MYIVRRPGAMRLCVSLTRSVALIVHRVGRGTLVDPLAF